MSIKLPVANAKRESTVLKYYFQFEHLAVNYAKKIHSTHRISYDLDDLIQEFKIKIYTSIIAYAAKWKKWKREGRYKPINIEIYIKSALNKRKIDFMMDIRDQQYITLSVEQDSFDYSILHSMESNINLKNEICVAEINGVNLIEGLTDLEGRCFMLYLYGFTAGKLSKVFKSKFEANKVIARQLAFLQTKREILLENRVTEFSSFKADAEAY